ncbi:MAG: flavin-containing monooxygenase [Burkholderiaceae bacterium]
MNQSANHDIAIIGAGFAGLGMAIALKQSGRNDFVVLERDAGVGGTWWANRYPGAACDIPSHLYSFSFALNPRWSRHYPQQKEIQAYLQDCAQRFDVMDHVQLNTAVTAARYDEADKHWVLELRDSHGQTRQLTARVLIGATGGLSTPKLPAIEGLESFAGIAAHSAQWPQQLNLRGKRVGVVGTGASAVQIVPAIIDQVVRLSLFQRTPAYVLPKPDRAIALWRRRLYGQWPWLQRVARSLIYLAHELRVGGFVKQPWLLGAVGRWSIQRVLRQVRDPALREKLTPRYTMGCKRILLENGFYPALQRDHAQVVTEPIARVEPAGVRTQDGTLHALDVLVLCTGFEAANLTAPFPITGRHGVSLASAWNEGPVAYLGTAMPNFPNLFLLAGPNSGLGHNSMVFMIESHIQFVMDALRTLDGRGALCAEVSAQAHDAYNAEIQRRLARTVWATGGCNSWYQSKSGRITTLWPGSTLEFRRRTRKLNPAHFVFS